MAKDEAGKRGIRTDGVLGRVTSEREMKQQRERMSHFEFSLYAYDHPEAPLGKVFHTGIHASLCWDGAKGLARDAFNATLEERGEDADGKHVIGKEFWIYRYVFSYTKAALWAQEGLARTLSGDYCDQVDELEVCCIWYERRADGAKFVCESNIGPSDPAPKMKRIGKYGSKGNAQNSKLL